MAGTVRTGSHQNILNSDGQRHPVQNALNFFFAFGVRMPLIHHRDHEKQIRVLREISSAIHFHRDAIVIHQLAVKPAALTARQKI